MGTGLVASLARPGGNITGLTILSPELGGKRLALLKEVVPLVSRVAVLLDPTNPATELNLQEMQVAARALGVQLQPVAVKVPSDIAPAFAALPRGRLAAMIVLPTPMFFDNRRKLADLAIKHRIAAVYQASEYVEAGGLMSYASKLS